MIPETERILDSIENIINEANKHRKNHFFMPYQREQLAEFIEAINPRFPLDSVDVLDLAFAVTNLGHFPHKKAIEILKNLLEKAEFGKEFVWKYRHPVLTAQINQEGMYYEVRFSGDKGATMFPIKVTVVVYCDMDDMNNHSDECPMRFDEDDPEYDNTCECSAFIERTETETFEHREDWIKVVEGWLYNAHYGIDQEDKN